MLHTAAAVLGDIEAKVQSLHPGPVPIISLYSYILGSMHVQQYSHHFQGVKMAVQVQGAK